MDSEVGMMGDTREVVACMEVEGVRGSRNLWKSRTFAHRPSSLFFLWSIRPSGD